MKLHSVLWCWRGLEEPESGFVSHLQAAKQIVVLDNGRVAEIGTHDQLVKRGGLYSELVSTQSLSLSLSV